MVSRIVFVALWATIQGQVLNHFQNGFIDDRDPTVLDVFHIQKASFPLLFADAHIHPVLTRMKQMNRNPLSFEGRRHHKRDNMFGNFDPNKFNSQVGQSYNPNAFNGGSGSTSTGGMSMFNPNAMMGAGSGSGTGSMFNPAAMMGGGTSSQSQSGGPTQSGGASSGSTSSGSSSGGSMPHYDPNNVINTGGKYDPNAANSGMGAASSGGSSPSFTNGMGMNAQQQLSPGASNWTGSASGSGGAAPGSGGSGAGSQTSGSAGSGTFDPNKMGSSGSGGSSSSGSSPASSFGSSTGGSAASSFGSPSGSSASSFGSSTGSGGSSAASFGSSSGSQSQTGSQTQSQSGSGSSSGASQTGGSSGGNTGTFDPIKTNSMATSGFNPLNPMLGKDMNQLMGPQSQTGAKGPGNFDPGAVNIQMGTQGMSLNMFGGAGGKTDSSKMDASSLMGGAQGMMSGSSSILGGGNAMLSGGGQTGGSGGSGSGGGQTGSSGGSGSGFGQTGGSSGSGSSGFNFDPNQMMGGGSGSGTSSGSSSSGGSSGGMSMFNPSAMMGGSSSGGSGGSGSTSGGSSGGMSMFNPNAMMGGGSINPMSPGGNMNPMSPGGGSMNPMNPGASMTGTGSSSGSRNSGSGSTILDPMGAMSGNARNFSGGANLIDPMGFMNGGGLTGSMTNMFNPSGRSIPIVGTDRLRRDTPQLNWRHGNFINTATGQAYNPMDPMGFIFQGNNKKFTKGNGVDTPGYNPDEYSYTYAGVNFQPFPVVPSSVGAFSPSYLNFGPNSIANLAGSDTNGTVNAYSTAMKPEASQQGQGSVESYFNQGMMTDLYQNVLNNTRLYSHAVYSGTPGMLGTGSQTQIIPQAMAVPTLTEPFINPLIDNLTETNLPDASYSGLPGMEGVGSQTQGSISTLDIAQLPQISALKQTNYGHAINYTTSNVSQSIYNSIPGILELGAGPSVSNNENIRMFGGVVENTTVDGSNTDSQGLGVQPIPVAVSGMSSYGMGAVQQTKVSNWNGDWPGKTSNGTHVSSKDQNWSGDWSENWPTISQQKNENSSNPERKSDQSVGGFGSFGQSSSQAMNWDGSWPGQSNKDASKSNPKTTEQTAENDKRPESLANTLKELKALIAQLHILSHNTSSSSTQEASHSKSFSELAAGWKDDIRNN